MRRRDPLGDRQARQGFIAGSIVFTVPGALAVLGLGYGLVPAPGDVSTELARLVLALRWLLVAVLPYVAVCLHIAGVRFFEGAHNPLLGTESEPLKIHCRVMQNTLEQFVWFACALLGLATLLPAERAGLIPVACGLFAFSRCVYWWGYLRSGTLGRAPGVQLTFTVNIGVLALALVLLARHLVG
jgi:uncharacterized membrane protein YecN with MAPEG domain